MPRDSEDTESRDSEGEPDHELLLAAIPDILKHKLRTGILVSEKQKWSTLISSNTLANQLIFERWGIRSSQRRRYRNLFTYVRRQCRNVFRHYLKKGWLEIRDNSTKYTFSVFRYDEKRGNLILGFVKVRRDSEWTIQPSGS